jgi:MFS family permease
VGEGVSWLAKHAVLRLVAAMIATFAFTQAMGLAILVVYGLRVLHLTGTTFGLFVAGGAVGNLVGALGADRVLRRFGTGRLLLGTGILAGMAFILVGTTASVAVALAAFILEAVAVGLGNVATLALRQSLIPRELAGRVNAALRMCISGAAALGALAGAALGTAGGVRAPFLAGGAMQLLAGVAIGLPLVRVLTRQRQDDELDVEEWVSGPAASATAEPAAIDVA